MENKILEVGAHKVELRPFVTGRQVQSLTDNIEDESMSEKKRNLAISNKSIELMVVSFDGSTENILNTILDLPFNEYKQILEAVNEVVDPKKNATVTPTT